MKLLLDIIFDLPIPRNKVRIKKMNIDGGKIIQSQMYFITTNKNTFQKHENSILLNNVEWLEEHKIIYYADGDGGFEFVEKIDESTIKVKSLSTFKIFINKAINCGKPIKSDFQNVVKILTKQFPFSKLLLSFVENAEEIEKFKKSINNTNKIVAKIETDSAIKNLDKILNVSDGVLLARGDLALNTPYEKLLELTELVFDSTKKAGKEVFNATDILKYSGNRLIPTRAELIDILLMFKLGTDNIILPSDFDLTGKKIQNEVIFKINQKIDIIRKCKSNYESIPRGL